MLKMSRTMQKLAKNGRGIVVPEHEAIRALPIVPDEPPKPRIRATTRPTRWQAMEAWLLRQIAQKGRLVRWLSWFVRLPGRMLSFARAILGPRVSLETHGERMKVCTACQHRIIRIDTRREFRVDSFCGLCRCPMWAMSELRRKNTLARAECPAGKFDSTANDRIREIVEKESACIKPDAAALSGGGCQGCGG